MSKVRKYMVKEAFKDQFPTKSMFEIVEEPLPKLKNNECLIKAEYISVDPYMRSFAEEFETPYLQFGFQVGKVIESKNKDYPVNSYVVSHSGWCDYAVIDGRPDDMFNMQPYAPDTAGLPVSLSVGALGMPGLAAYLGLLHVCKPARGETVCVTAAAGAVGSLVGQIARLQHCTVVGIAGTDHKVNLLKKELGFHHAFNYKTEKDIATTLKKHAANGIDCYFDNVGGSLSHAIMQCLSSKARVAICGAISTYNEASRRPETSRNSNVTSEAFSFTQWEWKVQKDALQQLRRWIYNKDIKAKETITEGFDKLPDAFIGMLKGENIGKAVVKV